jgi:hypothetical protein
MRVGDLVQVTHPNGAGAEGWYCQPGTLGIVTRAPKDRGRGFLEMEISASSVGARWFHVSGWGVVKQNSLFAGAHNG